MPEELVPTVEPRRISAQEPLHPRHQVSPGRFHYQMKVIGHQTPGMHVPVRLATALAQGGQEQFPILVIPEDRLPPIPPTHHVIDRPWIFDTQLARHSPTLPTIKRVSTFRTDPFPTPFRPDTRKTSKIGSYDGSAVSGSENNKKRPATTPVRSRPAQ